MFATAVGTASCQRHDVFPLPSYITGADTLRVAIVVIRLAPAKLWLMPVAQVPDYVIQPVCRLVFQDGLPVSVAAVMNPKHMAECDHR